MTNFHAASPIFRVRTMDAYCWRLTFGVALVFLVLGCERSPSEPEESLDVSQPLVPLWIGTRWSYELAAVAEIGTFDVPPMHYNVGVVGDTLIENETWAVLDTAQLLLHDNYAGRYYLTTRANSIYETAARIPDFPLPPSFSTAVLLFWYPTRVGDTRSFRVVTATDTLITVPAGSFRCLRYDRGPNETFFVAPAIGVVKKISGLIEGADRFGNFFRARLVHQLTTFDIKEPSRRN